MSDFELMSDVVYFSVSGIYWCKILLKFLCFPQVVI